MKVHQCRENEAHAYSAATSALHSAHIFPPLLCRCDLADSKSKGELCEVSPLLSVLLTGNKPLDFFILHVLRLWLSHSNYDQKILPFFQKNTRTAGLDRHSFLSVFLPYFTFLILGFLKKNRSYRNCEHEKMAWSSGFPVLVQLSHTRGRVVIPKEIRRTMRIR